MRLFIAKIEEAISWMVRVKTQFGAVFAETTASAHHERLSATVAEFIFALCTCEVHATTPKMKYKKRF